MDKKLSRESRWERLAPQSLRGLGARSKVLGVLGRLLVLAVFAAAAWLLYNELRKHTLAEILAALRGISAVQIVLAVTLTAINYVILVGYDWLAVRWVGEKLPLRKIALASFAGYAFSYNFGATLFGAPIRFRLYSSWGVPLAKIVQLLVILGLTFWFGVFALAGAIFVFDPLPLPKELAFLPVGNIRWLGAALLAITMGYLALVAAGNAWLIRAERARIAFRGRQFRLPPFRLTLYQLLIASADLIVAAAVLYQLLPPMEGVGFIRVLSIFLLGFVLTVLTHVPGGYGVMEATLINFLPRAHAAQVIAAILVLRVIYYWLPLVVGAGLVGWHEISMRERRPPDQADDPPAPECGSAPPTGLGSHAARRPSDAGSPASDPMLGSVTANGGAYPASREVCGPAG